MRDYFTLNGESSADFSAYLSRSNIYDVASDSYESVSVPGRNGDLHLSNGRYNNRSQTDVVYLLDPEQIDNFMAWVGSFRAYARYESTRHPEHFRQAKVVSCTIGEQFDMYGAVAEIVYDTKPQKFLKTGEQSRTVLTGDTLYNPTKFSALPLIRVEGTGTLQIGSQTLTVTNAGTSYIDLDSELQDAYEGTTNRNSYVTGDFPTLDPGSNGITFTGFTSVTITPRWWTL